MDYKEKYEQALSKARQFSENPLLEDSSNIVEYIFPELAEAEDSRIRKEMIEVIRKEAKEFPSSIIAENASSWIAWLEKQVSPVLSNSSNVGKDEDKIEPKFKNGDWITNGIETVQITGYDIDYGYQVDYKGNLQHRDTDIIEKEYHLWTIQNARSGDVLHCWIDGDEFVLIYKGIKDGYITTYGHLYQKLKSFSEEPTSMFCRTIQGHFTPATKEQRDLLFKKMKEAGYEWDAEKKELRKIEQMFNWSEEDEEILKLIKFAVLNLPSQREDTRQECLAWLESLKSRIHDL